MFVILLFVVFSILSGCFCQTNPIPGRLLGFSSECQIVPPRSEFSSWDMTLTKCLDVCGLLFKPPGVAAIKGDFCMCGNLPQVMNVAPTCKPLKPCRIDPTEDCGCESAYAYYATDYKGQCDLTLITGPDDHSGTSSKASIQLFGDFECAEVILPNVKPGQLGPMGSNCRELGTIRRLRLGLFNPMWDWYIVKAIVRVPGHTPNYIFNFDNWLGQQTLDGITYGKNYSAVDLFPNGSYIYPEISGGPFFKNFSEPEKPSPFICSLNSGKTPNLNCVNYTVRN